MRKKTKLISLMLFCISALQVQAQQQTLKGGAPDAKMTPGLSGDGNNGSIYSPNLFNGTANVNVPIYSYGANGISLSYNTAGVKVDELSGPVGLHWSLNAGGSITRIMKDVPDEINRYNGTVSTNGNGDLGNYNLGVKGKWCRDFGGVNPTDVAKDAARYQDDESDDFIFSVGGLSFTFNIGKDRFIFTNPHTNIKIDILINGTPVTQMPLSSDNSSLNFRIRDAQGNWYYFIVGDIGKKNYQDLELQYTSKWVISKIVRNDGTEIKFTYNSIDLVNNASITNLYNSFSTMEYNASVAAAPQSSFVRAQDVCSINSNIATISYPNNITATFVYDQNSDNRCDDPGNKMGNPILREIKISSGTAGTRYILDQGYMLSTYNNNTIPYDIPLSGPCNNISSAVSDKYRYHRLFLKGIRMSNLDGTVTEPYYSFAYNTLRLPPRFSGSQDYYGYYNGKTVTQNNSMLTIPSHIPTGASSSATYGVNRDVDANFVAAGLLTAGRL